MEEIKVKVPSLPRIPIPKDLYADLRRNFDNRSIILITNDGGTRASISYWQLPVSDNINIAEVSTKLFIAASSMKGVDE